MNTKTDILIAAIERCVEVMENELSASTDNKSADFWDHEITKARTAIKEAQDTKP